MLLFHLLLVQLTFFQSDTILCINDRKFFVLHFSSLASSRITRDFNSPLVLPQSSSSGTSQPIIQAGPSSQPPVPPWQPQTGSGYQPTMRAGPASPPSLPPLQPPQTRPG